MKAMFPHTGEPSSRSFSFSLIPIHKDTLTPTRITTLHQNRQTTHQQYTCSACQRIEELTTCPPLETRFAILLFPAIPGFAKTVPFNSNPAQGSTMSSSLSQGSSLPPPPILCDSVSSDLGKVGAQSKRPLSDSQSEQLVKARRLGDVSSTDYEFTQAQDDHSTESAVNVLRELRLREYE
ncbi:hypothetical protein K457DRAFT_635307 [Linnemannia elongata AG-77]|uniref:Uncharacterized protein n=1 Tax=Linnemannia elongata AG-77 TaxID=1314771 RepID=A0A197JQ80_9FUNG|nr:hypothetical protein K457DRAFT_635307 [Linnemannia elongata AG-77]